MNAWALYGRYVSVSVRSQLQYRAAVWMQSVGHLLVTGVEFLGLWALFERFGGLEGWTLAQAALFYGLVNVGFSVADATARGFDTFAQKIRMGDFDRILLRPRSTVLQIAGSELTVKRVGRLLQGLVVIAWGWWSLGLGADLAAAALMLWALVGTVCLFYGIIVVQATITFWTTESLELMNTITYGGVETAQYPMAIYQRWFRRFFTFVVPLACVSYFPVVAVIGRDDPLGSPLWFQWVSPVMGVLFLAGALRLWRFGERHYTSVGS